MSEKQEKKLEKWFFGFWVRRYKVSYLAIFLLIFTWLYSLIFIPKESSPDVKLGIISINTIYPWVNPTDMDALVTDKVEKAVKDIDWVKKIKSSSWVGSSSVIVELETGAESRNVLTDIKDEVDKISLPEDAEDPIVSEISTNSDLIFEVLLYWDEKRFSKYDLMQKAQFIKANIESKIVWLSKLELASSDLKMWWKVETMDYQIQVLLDKNKLEELWLSISYISSIIKSYNKNTPIGNYAIWGLYYDFRFQWELSSVEDLKNIVIRSNNGSKLILKDIAVIKAKYPWDSINKLWFEKSSWYNYVSLLFSKSDNVGIFSVSKNAKESLEKILKESSDLEGLDIFYVKDMSELIKDDYNRLWNTALQTLILVFIIIFLFIGLKESLIASLLLPLAFFITFIFLNTIGYSLNFLTNFSLVLTLWIAIDTVIVIIEWSTEKQKLGYNKKEAALLAVREFSSPLISGTLTTLSAFLPLIFLPWIMWKFLSYIPITVFSTLLGALILSLSVSSALFVLFAKDKKTYYRDEKLENTFSAEQKEFLEYQRRWKIQKTEENLAFRDKVLDNFSMKYYMLLQENLAKFSFKFLVIFSPIILLILSFVFLSPNIWFTLFPATDESILTWEIKAKSGTEKSYLEKYLKNVDNVISKIPEIKVYNTKLDENYIYVYMELKNKVDRKEKWLRSIFEVEKELSEEFKKLESYWLQVVFQTLKNWPPTWKAVWIQLIAESAKDFATLKEVSEDLKSKFEKIPWTKNVSTTSSDSPWQFIFKFDNEKLTQVWLNPDDIIREVYLYTNWLKSGSIKSKYEDNDIVLKIEEFDEKLSPESIENLIVNTKIWKVRVGDFLDYDFEKSVIAINRKDSKISVTVEADLALWFDTSEVQPKLEEVAKNYHFPLGISYKSAWENEENAELIFSTIMSFFIALFLIFSILVFQFNSFFQPAIVLFSVALALLWVNVWLYLTSNPYSMTFGIWFIALTWVVVNDAIILIDMINKNLKKWIDLVHSVVWAAKSRLQPIIVTTLTTVFWVLPLAFQDEFWAPLGFTIIFGLITGSTMTLFSIPTLYFWVYDKKNRKVRKDLTKR